MSKLIEVQGDLFANTAKDDWLAQCISADFAMGAGIALQFNEQRNVRNGLKNQYGYHIMEVFKAKGPQVLEYNNVFNLVTKCECYTKPTLSALCMTIQKMKMIAVTKGIKKISMPRIGCGIDGLDWEQVKKAINCIFEESDIQIVVYYI